LVPPDFRTKWRAQLQNQIKAVESGQVLANPDNEVNPIKRQIKEADRQRAKAVQEEYYDVRRSVDTIAALVKAGSTTQAQKEIDALVKRYPNNPAALILAENLGMNQRVADARMVVAQQQEGYLLAMRSVDKSAIPPKGDIEFDPVRFKEISESKFRRPAQLTKKEQAIMKSLDKTISLGFKDVTFQEVIKFISNETGQNILIEKSALTEAGLDTSSTVSINLRDVSARTALRKLLQDQQLTFVIKDETIQVVTLARAREMLVTRVYYLGDLVRLNGPFGGAVTWGPWMDMMQTKENVDRIIDMVKAIDPESWKDRGGNGTVIFNWPSMSMVVRQTAEFHARMSGLGGR
jgi:hypothetical protein